MASEKKSSPADEAPQSNPADEAGADELQATFDEAADKGYFGETPDDTPNENYTLKGVTSGKPTPESQPEK